MNLTQDDVKRVIWTFVMAAAAVFFALSQDWFESGGELNWKVWLTAAIAAGVSAIKNLFTQPGDILK